MPKHLTTRSPRASKVIRQQPPAPPVPSMMAMNPTIVVVRSRPRSLPVVRRLRGKNPLDDSIVESTDSESSEASDSESEEEEYAETESEDESPPVHWCRRTPTIRSPTQAPCGDDGDDDLMEGTPFDVTKRVIFFDLETNEEYISEIPVTKDYNKVSKALITNKVINTSK